MNIGKINIDIIIFLAIVILICIFRYLIIYNFGFDYTDSDQTVMWLGLKNYSHGMFYEPRFYGQSYSTMLEALFAVPLYWAGMPVYKALPVVTTFMTVLPFIIIAYFVFRQKKPKISFIILMIPLLLPLEYSLITTMPRGFVAGIFIASLGCIAMFYRKSKWAYLLSGFAAVIAFSVNPNSLFLSFFCLAFLFLNNIKFLKFYIFTLAGAIIGAGLHFMVNYFYVLHPFYDLHRMYLSFSFASIPENFTRLDLYFNYVSPVFWKKGFLVLVLFILVSIILFIKKEYKSATIVLLLPFLFILALGLNKTNDGYPSIFFSYSRMFLSVPLLLGLSVSLFPEIKTRYYYVLLAIPIVFFIHNNQLIESSINKDFNPYTCNVVSVFTTTNVVTTCRDIKKICDEKNIGLVITTGDWYADVVDYGCPACQDSFPATLRPEYERRTWRLLEDEKKIYKNILIEDLVRDFSKEFNFVKKFTKMDGIYIIENNDLKTMDLLVKLNIPCRKYK